jgi:hypothetical protein
MTRERLSQDWIDRMYFIFENEPRTPDYVIAEQMKSFATEWGRNDYPKLRTIQKYRQAYRASEPEVKAQYRLFQWPESMIQGDLPWEASRASLELRAFLDVLGIRTSPPLSLVKWFWRVTLADPQARIDLRLSAAAGLARQEALEEPFDRGYEWWLAYMQIPGDEDRKKLYEAAQRRPPEDHPIPKVPTHLSASTKDGVTMAFWMDLIYTLAFRVGEAPLPATALDFSHNKNLNAFLLAAPLV